MTTAHDTTGPRVVDHWWWRPGWGIGTRFYTWHLTFEGQHALHEKAAVYRDVLAGFDCLDPVPDPWLHLTMQGVGDAKDVTEREALAVADAACPRLAAIPAFDLEFDRPVFTPEAIRWDPPGSGPAAVRLAIRDAIAQVWTDVPESEAGFGAHVTIAYGNRAADATPILDAIDAVPSDPAIVRISAASLILLNRDNKMYEWETVATVPLGNP